MKIYEGDILTAPVKIIVHQCNCQNTMGSGIAKYLRSIYPDIYKADCDAANKGENKLGNVSFVETPDKRFVIINMYGQNLYGTESRKTNYEAYYCGLEKVRIIADEMGDDKDGYYTVGFPYLMGCDRAGGNWNICRTMIEQIFDGYKGEVLICKLKE